jgi:hypothetical protein
VVKYNLSEIRKTLVGVVGFALTVLATILTVGPDLIDEDLLPWVIVALAVGSSYGIFKVPNQPAPGQPRRPGVSEVADPVGGITPDDGTVVALSHLDQEDTDGPRQ